MTQRVFDVNVSKDVEDLFNLFPDIVNKLVRDATSPTAIYCYKDAELIDEQPITMIYVNWQGKHAIERPIEIQKGMVGYFWDEGSEVVFGRLDDYGKDYYVPEGSDTWFRYFRPLTDKELCNILGCKKIVR